MSCGRDFAGPAVSISVGITPSEVNMLILIAQDQGYFARNGLDITTQIYPSGVAGLGGLAEHEVDLATGSEFALV
ncbi:MAG TPA: aliphatic sulfonates ABC transporter substrate-binding protein, partial [Anaerolineae bacterium]|nr:aliphatic sulfonates ABC transporter substrate-binding protein [Anaerolineae bacterium]